jgi:PIF1-like helicase/Helix-turn-helix domain
METRFYFVSIFWGSVHLKGFFLVFAPFFHTLIRMNQDEAFDILAMGQNVFLTWAAGSGKTYLVNRFVTHCKEHGIGIAITASTGIAATHIGGMTIHSWSGLGIRDILSDEDIDTIISREYIVKRFAKTSVLIIDEISMLSWGFLSNLDRLLRSARVSMDPFGGMQVVLVGDFFQLPPVSRDSSYVEFAFEHSIWREARLIPCVLTTQYRQGVESRKWKVESGGIRHREGRSDPVFPEAWIATSSTTESGELLAMTEHEGASQDPLLSILNEIRSGKITTRSLALLESRHIPVVTQDHTELFTRNVSVDAYNKWKLDSIAGDIFIFDMHSKGSLPLIEALKKWCLAPETLVLKIGARVMFVKNNFEAWYANGSIGHVTGRYEWLPIVELPSGEKIIVDYASWAVEEHGRIKAEIAQVPLRLAWAITIHKSQGMTLDSAVMDLSDAFVAGQWYVALSRVRSLEWLILKWLNHRALEIDLRVRDYDELLSMASDRARERLVSMSGGEKKEKMTNTIIRLDWVLEKIDLSVKVKKWSKTATHEETYTLLQMWLTLEEISVKRTLKISTIYAHVEKLLEEGKSIDLSKIRPSDEDRLSQILDAFTVLSTESLSPVREYLFEKYGDEYDYDEVRLARLFLTKK